MENIVINLPVNNSELLDTIALLEKLGTIEAGTVEAFKKASAARLQIAAQHEAQMKENISTQQDLNTKLEKTNALVKEIPKAVAGGALTDSMKKFNDETDKAVVKQTSLKAQLRAMKAELATLDEGSIKFNKLSIEAAELEDKLGDVQQRVRNLASDTAGINALISGAQGVTGAFAVAEGGVALFGTQSEELQKTLLKVNAAMAILQGLQQVQAVLMEESAAKSYVATAAQKLYALVVAETTGALKAMRIAFALTGIGAVILGLGFLISKFMEAKRATEAAAESQKLFQESLKESNDRLNSLAEKAEDSALRVRVAMGNITNFEAERIKLQRERDTALVDSDKRLKDTLAKLEEDNTKRSLAEKKYNVEAEGLYLKRKEELNRKYFEEQEIIEQDYSNRLALINREEQIRKADINEQARAKRIADSDKEFENFVQNLRNQIEARQRADAILKANDEKDKADRKKYYDDLAKAAADYKAKVEKEYSDLTEILDRYNQHLINQAKARGDETNNLELGQLEDRLRLAELYGKRTVEIEDEIALKKRDIKQQEREDYVNFLSDALNYARQASQAELDYELNLLQNQFDQKQISAEEFSRKAGELKVKEAERERNFALFNIGISTAEAIIKFLANPGGPPGVILSALAAVTGGLQLAAVLSKPIPAFAKGKVGLEGPGTGTSDSILMRASRGESVITAEATAKNRGVLEAMNAGIINTEAINRALPPLPSILVPLPGHSDYAHFDFDYDKFGSVIAKKMKENPSTHITFDRKGFSASLITESAHVTFINDYYSSK